MQLAAGAERDQLAKRQTTHLQHYTGLRFGKFPSDVASDKARDMCKKEESLKRSLRVV